VQSLPAFAATHENKYLALQRLFDHQLVIVIELTQMLGIANRILGFSYPPQLAQTIFRITSYSKNSNRFVLSGHLNISEGGADRTSRAFNPRSTESHAVACGQD
jgi:hypothetical protein